MHIWFAGKLHACLRRVRAILDDPVTIVVTVRVACGCAGRDVSWSIELPPLLWLRCASVQSVGGGLFRRLQVAPMLFELVLAELFGDETLAHLAVGDYGVVEHGVYTYLLGLVAARA